VVVAAAHTDGAIPLASEGSRRGDLRPFGYVGCGKDGLLGWLWQLRTRFVASPRTVLMSRAMIAGSVGSVGDVQRYYTDAYGQ